MRTALVLTATLWVVVICSIHMLTAAEPEPCLDADIREQVRIILFEGIDLALRDRTKQLFEVWMKDHTDQPERAIAGMRNGILAYAGARRAATEWSPPVCKGDRQ
jgi:hypothetical protein